MSHFSCNCSQQGKPQSIVHQIGRIGSKLTKKVSKRRKRTRMERKLRESTVTKSLTADSDIDSLPTAEESYPDNCSVDFSVYPTVPISDYEGDSHSIDSDDAFSFFGDDEQESDNEDEEEEGLFETVDQNQFLLECFLTNGQSDMTLLVHFFNEETSVSNAIEDVLTVRVLETGSKCECRRINSKSAPLFTAKLQIDPEQPTVVAIKNGKVLSKVSNVSSAECSEVDQWLNRTRILQRGSTSSNDATFSSLSTSS